jgi:CheY-like chemotaxis protein
VIALYREFEPDVILLDLSMPHLDGFEIMARLRALIPRRVMCPSSCSRRW